MNRQKGMGLLELLIGLFLASIILTVLMQFYLNNKRQYTESQSALETWFDVQWVSGLLGDSIRKAGFTPCLGINQLSTKGLRGESLQAIRSQPQSLQISRMSELFAPIKAFQSSTELLVPDEGSFKERHLLLIADCEHAEVHQILSVEQMAGRTLITLDKPLQFTYDSPAYAGEWLEEQWFIKTNEQGIKALYYKLVHSEELSPLIHSLHTRIQSEQGKQLVEAVLGWDEDKEHHLTVMVRGS
ncbi:prepilin-type N-terminal cleavage/methylation domain-containing protein [Legionella shakespearei]|uniref:Tfp pilus assembly protein PilW n=1 Tax=Legionella shakespearei DSM 23087 TaxID=1122169 RepID=A0A0W0Z8J7_9GAMM|nr:prepilin-type N-terminal cleavage/methylation domain-containing protein [Legionella shakespearei]KTD65436.1 hypothetical protein Lsha_0253 [Legionella shakespearei DSM 23087]